MQVTSLNKIISMFLVGGLLLIIAAAILIRHGLSWFAPAPMLQLLAGAGGEGVVAVLGGLLLLPLAALGGAVCEGLTDATLREGIKWISKKRLRCAMLGCGRVFDSHSFWRDRFLEAASSGILLKNFPVTTNVHGLAVGLLYQRAGDQAIRWAETHYSTYTLTSNFAFLGVVIEGYIMGAFAVGSLSAGAAAWAACAALVVVASSGSLALDRLLYSYTVAMRQSTLVLLQDRSSIAVCNACEGEVKQDSDS